MSVRAMLCAVLRSSHDHAPSRTHGGASPGAPPARWPALRGLAAIAGLVFCTTGAAAAPVSAIDDTGARVTLATPARRIISLAPSVTEMIYAAGGGDRLVG